MIGLGKWQGTVNIQILKFSGDVIVTISDNGGEYNVDIQLPKQLEKVKLRFDSIEEVGDNALKGKGKVLTLTVMKWAVISRLQSLTSKLKTVTELIDFNYQNIN